MSKIDNAIQFDISQADFVPIAADDALLGVLAETPPAPVTGPEGSPRYTAALEYAKQGLKIFPLRPGKTRPIFKEPFENASCDPAVIAVAARLSERL
jgi:hypothetical protein